MQKQTKDILKRSAIRSLWIVALVLLVYLLQGCGNPRLAPIEERDATGNGAELHSFYPPTEVDNSQQFYFVQPADTLYSIAFRYGLDYKTLADVNNIDAAYTIYPGQKLDLEKARLAENSSITNTSTVATNTEAKKAVGGSKVIARRSQVQEISRTAPTKIVAKEPEAERATSQQEKETKPKSQVAKKTSVDKPKRKEKAQPVRKQRPKPAQTQTFVNKSVKYWMWPNMGRIIKRFSSATNSRGIDIAGNIGEPVRAAAPGLVVYAGRGLRGYGNLIIVKHNSEFISAYAHNKRLLVKENEIIKAGQKIAEVGNTDSDIPKLHFEIRYKGKPVDPLRYLPKR
ncbi:peptidoglycan DD-metalloendopeptidase family protein [Kangiella sediminilitoris]|uniref:Peptidase M23 n=1 Tax=Kangiella sediminilitoris TaxID=1144748 RepID=A0A1B3BBQ0_9GAMM|nr:peptidoglycan DD-metalloendopeptidase family protein [Kangiella sediminilitoris]AOE50222.1 Peptidase M23 [Kangiella sediminilitoris]